MGEMKRGPDDGNGDRGERDVPSTAERIAANDQVGREWIGETELERRQVFRVSSDALDVLDAQQAIEQVDGPEVVW